MRLFYIFYIDNNQKLTRNSEGYIIIEAHNEQSNG
nr:MAG TPA: hypothetical protein [Caudoviricetes sp.]